MLRPTDKLALDTKNYTLPLRDMLEKNLTSSEAVAFFLHALTERKRQNYCMMQLQLARFPSNWLASLVIAQLNLSTFLE